MANSIKIALTDIIRPYTAAIVFAIAANLILCPIAFGQNQKPRFVVSVSGELEVNIADVLADEISYAIIKTGRYDLIANDRQFKDALKKEWKNGNVDDDKIIALAKKAGADYICFAKIKTLLGSNQITAQLVDLKTMLYGSMGKANGALNELDQLTKISQAVVADMIGFAEQANPFTITNVEFYLSDGEGNNGSYSKEFQAHQIKFINFTITYDNTGFFSGNKDLYIKVIRPDGSLISASSSPSGYSYKYSLPVSSGEKGKKASISGWGSKEGGTYNKDGNYAFEIWSEDKKLYSSSFYVKADAIPITYEGQTYKTVKMPDGKVWFAENLNYAASGSKCHNNEPANCEKYGRLYNWNTALSACPRGWHLPSSAEWSALLNAVGRDMAGTKLRTASGWGYTANFKSGTDNYGFSALPGSGHASDHSFGLYDKVGTVGCWWSASKYDNNRFYYLQMFSSDEYVSWLFDVGGALFSVRCVRE